MYLMYTEESYLLGMVNERIESDALFRNEGYYFVKVEDYKDFPPVWESDEND